MEVPLRWSGQTGTGSKDLVLMITADLPNPSYEFGHLLQRTDSCLETFIHNVNSLSHKNMSLVVYLMALHRILRLSSDGMMRWFCTVNRKLIWRILLWSISAPRIRIRLREQKNHGRASVRIIECRTNTRYRWGNLIVRPNFHVSHHKRYVHIKYCT
jgi:hypothetical protein